MRGITRATAVSTTTALSTASSTTTSAVPPRRCSNAEWVELHYPRVTRNVSTTDRHSVVTITAVTTASRFKTRLASTVVLRVDCTQVIGFIGLFVGFVISGGCFSVYDNLLAASYRVDVLHFSFLTFFLLKKSKQPFLRLYIFWIKNQATVKWRLFLISTKQQ